MEARLELITCERDEEMDMRFRTAGRLECQLEQISYERDRLIETSNELRADLRFNGADKDQTTTTSEPMRVADTLRAMRQRRREEAAIHM